MNIQDFQSEIEAALPNTFTFVRSYSPLTTVETVFAIEPSLVGLKDKYSQFMTKAHYVWSADQGGTIVKDRTGLFCKSQTNPTTPIPLFTTTGPQTYTLPTTPSYSYYVIGGGCGGGGSGTGGVGVCIKTAALPTKNCECGSDKIGSNHHSSWCPKGE